MVEVTLTLHDAKNFATGLRAYSKIHPGAEILFALTAETNNDDHDDYVRFPIAHVRIELLPLLNFCRSVAGVTRTPQTTD